MADMKSSKTRSDGDRTRAREEAMHGACGDRFGVTDTSREGISLVTARPTLHLFLEFFFHVCTYKDARGQMVVPVWFECVMVCEYAW
jgi:hypothetical protein